MGIKYEPAVDGLRAFAVLIVVAYHAGLPIRAGFVGVDVFFVISGFVITRLLTREPDLWAFYARRVRRILPALVLVIVSTVLLSAVFLPGASQLAVNRSATASLAMVANFHFQYVTGGYFDTGADHMPLLHLWSLAVEEQFYFVWPLLLMLPRRWWLVAIAIASFAFAQYWVWVNPEAAFYQMPARLWELAAGGLLTMTRPSRFGKAHAIAGLALLTVAAMVPSPQFPGVGALPAVAGTLLVLSAVHAGTRIPPLEWKPVRYIGLISYSLYLWHWPLLVIGRDVLHPLVLVGAAVVLAALTYRYVEQPFRRGVARPRVVVTGVVACALLAGCTSAMDSVLKRAGGMSVRIALDAPIESSCQGFDAQCQEDVVLWGDSHAKHWEPFAERYGVVRQLSMDNCLPSAVPGTRGCATFNMRALAVAKRAPVVVVGGIWMDKLAREQGREDFRSVLEALPNRVVVIGPLPMLPHWPEDCIRKGDLSLCSVSRADFERRAAPIRSFMRAEVAKHPNVTYIEPANFFCSPTLCPMTKDGYSLYYDDDHITVSAARAFTSSLSDRL
jgi:peptidoglycan/LPS O-acetylase OafA/YrhL